MPPTNTLPPPHIPAPPSEPSKIHANHHAMATNPTQLQCKLWTRKRDVRWEKEWGGRSSMWERERESKWETKVRVGENKRWKRIKNNFFGLQLSYSVIIHLGWHCSTIAIFFLQLEDFTKLGNGQFLCLDAKIYQNIAYRRPDVNALRDQT